MRNDATLKTLLDHQQRILAHFAKVVPLIEGTATPDIGAMACRRWQAVRMLREYQIFKHRFIFDPAIAQGDALLRDQAVQMKARCEAMGDALREHVMTWGGGAAAARSTDYIRAVKILIAALRAHIEREGKGVGVLLAHPLYAGR